MKIYELRKKQVLASDAKTVWSFLSNPKNLKEIMPKQMKFEIKSGLSEKMYAGQILVYSVSPFSAYKTTWVTEITQVDEPNLFVDNQVNGPFKMWHHKHFVREVSGGVEVEDIIHYSLPLGWIGQILHPLLIQPKLEKIFAIRKQQMKALFGEIK
ncbi:MAG: SRPBCC family protein [Bacteroidota bacterium]